MQRSSSVANKIFCWIFSLPRSSAWKLSHQSSRKITADLFYVRRTDEVQANWKGNENDVVS